MATKSKKVAAEPEFDKYMVLVLGMHRSGTSSFTGLMNLLGCALPEDLMPKTEANPKGYFESIAVSRFNDRMLETAGASWRDWHPINASWLASPVGQAFLPQARDLLETEFGTTPLAILKDPRICRMVPFWTKAISMSGYRVLPVLIHRNPVEVAASLKKRDGIELVEGHLIWLRHVLDAEKATRGQPRFITSYTQILSDWSEEMARFQKELGVVLPRSDRRAATEIDAFLSPALRHFAEPSEKLAQNEAVPAWVRDTHCIFERWVSEGEDKADYKLLDVIAAQVDSVTPAFAELVDAGKRKIKTLNETVSKYEAKKSDTERLKEDLATVRQELTSHQTTLAEREATLEFLQKDLSHAESALAQRNEEAQQAWQRAERAEASLTEVQKHLEEQLNAEKAAGLKRVAELEAELANAQAGLTKLTHAEAALETVTAQQKVHLNELSQMAQLMSQTEDRLQSSQSETQELRGHMAVQAQETTRLQAETAAQQARIKFVENELVAIRSSKFWRLTGPMRRLLDAIRGRK